MPKANFGSDVYNNPCLAKLIRYQVGTGFM